MDASMDQFANQAKAGSVIMVNGHRHQEAGDNDGYHRSETHFQHNERAATFSFGLYWEDPGVYQLEDVMEPQVVNLEFPPEGDRFMLDILEVYPGDVYRDLVISEMRFFDGEDWFLIDTGGSETRKRGILEWAQDTPMGAFIDKQIYNRDIGTEDHYEFHYQSLILRSNGSFVIWKTDEWDNLDIDRMYADGNWQILTDSSVRIFGRLNRVGRFDMEPYDPYAGSWPDQGQNIDRTTVFSDTLRFGDGWLTSDRGLFEDFEY